MAAVLILVGLFSASCAYLFTQDVIVSISVAAAFVIWAVGGAFGVSFLPARITLENKPRLLQYMMLGVVLAAAFIRIAGIQLTSSERILCDAVVLLSLLLPWLWPGDARKVNR